MISPLPAELMFAPNQKPHADASPPQTRERVAGHVLLVAAVALSVVLGMRRSGDPWESGVRGMDAAFYNGNPVRHYLRHGIVALRGGAVIQSVPSEPPYFFFYTHHPATF